MEITKYSNKIKISYFSYFLILVLIILLNIFYQENISVLMESSSSLIFYIFIFLQCLNGISQIIFLILILDREANKIFSLLSKIILVLAIISFSITLAITYFYYITNKNYLIFYRDCPFNYKISDINNMINTSTYLNISTNKVNNIESNSKCNNRVWKEQNIINNNNNNNYCYFCNFNSNYKDLIFCNNQFDINIVNSNIIQNYDNFCSSKIELYFCQRNKEPTKYSIDYNYICPTKEKRIIIFG